MGQSLITTLEKPELLEVGLQAGHFLYGRARRSRATAERRPGFKTIEDFLAGLNPLLPYVALMYASDQDFRDTVRNPDLEFVEIPRLPNPNYDTQRWLVDVTVELYQKTAGFIAEGADRRVRGQINNHIVLI